MRQKVWKPLWAFYSCVFTDQQCSPAILATVLLCDPVLVFTPDVHGRENQGHQYSKAAHQGKDHNALLLRLQERIKKQQHLNYKGTFSALHRYCRNTAKVLQPWLLLAVWLTEVI